MKCPPWHGASLPKDPWLSKCEVFGENTAVADYQVLIRPTQSSNPTAYIQKEH